MVSGRARGVSISASACESTRRASVWRAVLQLQGLGAFNLSVTRLVSAIVVALLSLSMSSVGLSQPLPVPCCDMPSADSCLYRFSRSGDGTIEAGRVPRYPCGGDSALRASADVRLRLTPNRFCDELKGLLPAQLILHASRPVIRRS